MDRRVARSWMLFGLAGVIVISAIWLSAHLSARPRLAVSDVDLGSYIPGQTLERAICIRNEGSRALAIYAVKPCCGMTLPFGFPRAVGARSEAYVVVHMSTPVSGGLIGANLVLHTNDPRNPETRMAIRATPDESVQVSPPQIDLGHVIAGRAFVSVSTIQFAEQQPTTPTIVSSGRDLKVSLRQNEDGHGMPIDLALAENAQRGPLREYLFVKTGVGKRPTLAIPVSGVVERGLRLRPQQVYFGVVSGTERMTRCVTLEVIGPGWEVPEVNAVAHQGIRARLERTGEARFDLCVSLDPTKMAQTVNSCVTLSSRTGDTIEIPVIAVRERDTERMQLR